MLGSRKRSGPTIRSSGPLRWAAVLSWDMRQLSSGVRAHMQVPASLFFFAPLMASVNAVAPPATISASCRSLIDSDVKNWHVPVVSKDVADWAQQEHFNPVVAGGDFDGNGEADQAVLVETGNSVKIAVCFSRQQRKTLRLIEQPYCSDYVAMSAAHSEHYNYETGTTERIKRDGISVGCFEKAGATYVYEHGTFRRIVDSD